MVLGPIAWLGGNLPGSAKAKTVALLFSCEDSIDSHSAPPSSSLDWTAKTKTPGTNHEASLDLNECNGAAFAQPTGSPVFFLSSLS